MIKHPIPLCLDQINVEKIINFILSSDINIPKLEFLKKNMPNLQMQTLKGSLQTGRLIFIPLVYPFNSFINLKVFADYHYFHGKCFGRSKHRYFELRIYLFRKIRHTYLQHRQKVPYEIQLRAQKQYCFHLRNFGRIW